MEYSIMKRLFLLPVFALVLMANSCDQPKSVKNVESDKARAAAESLRFTENAEIENIKRRLQLTADPGKFGFIVLMNEAGQPVLYEGVKGKVTSGGKRLTRVDEYVCYEGACRTRQAASDEGTFGHSGEYVFYWNIDGVYRQWNGKYIYSDQPIRLRVDPLVITTEHPK
jgi:hypothetical protein